MTAAATTATTMATTITGRLESLRQMSHNPRLCSGVTIHERSNRGRRLRQRRDNDGNDDEDKQLINHHHFIILLSLTEALHSIRVDFVQGAFVSGSSSP